MDHGEYLHHVNKECEMLHGLNNRKVLEFNLSLVQYCLLIHKRLSLAELSRLTGLSVTAVGRLADTLIEQDVVHFVKAEHQGRGRTNGLLALKHMQGYIVCLNVRPDGIDSLLCTDFCEPVADIQTTPMQLTSKEDLIATLKHIISAYRSQVEPATLRVAIAMHGQVDYANGISLFMPQAPWHESLHVKFLLEKELNVEVVLDNDCVMRALAQKWSFLRQGTEVSDLCVINIDYGVGSAFLMNGSIFRGPLFSSGQIGHTIVDPNGRLCSCGRVGCLETIASQRAVCHAVNRQRPKEQALNYDDIVRLYFAGDFAVRQVVDFAAINLGRAIYNFLNVININHIYLYGSLCLFGYDFLNTVSAQALRNPFDDGTQVKSTATSIEFGTLTAKEQLAGIGYLYAERTLNTDLDLLFN